MLLCATGAAAQTLSPREFRDQLAAKYADETGNAATFIDDQTFTIKLKSGRDVQINIDNSYEQYKSHPGDLQSILSRHVSVLARGDDDLASLDRLIVIVRPKDYLVNAFKPGADLSQFLRSRPFAGDLALFLAVDAPESIRTANIDDLKRWKVDEDNAWARAIENITKRVGTLGLAKLGNDDGPSGVIADSGLAPSILADPKLCGPEHPDGMAKQVILLYQRDMFLFAFPEDADQTLRFWRAAKQEVEAGRSMSNTPLTCRNGKWIVAERPK